MMLKTSEFPTCGIFAVGAAGLGPESEGKRLTQNSESLLKVPVKLGLNRRGWELPVGWYRGWIISVKRFGYVFVGLYGYG